MVETQQPQLDPRIAWEFRFGRKRMFALALLSGLIAWLAWADAHDALSLFGWRPHLDWHFTTLGLLGAFVAPALLLRMARDSGSVLVVSPQGFEDTRWTRGMIPWSAVAAVDFVSLKGAQHLVMTLDPAFPIGDKVRSAGFRRQLAKLTNIEGYIVSTNLLSEDKDKIDALILRQFERSRAVTGRARRDAPAHFFLAGPG